MGSENSQLRTTDHEFGSLLSWSNCMPSGVELANGLRDAKFYDLRLDVGLPIFCYDAAGRAGGTAPDLDTRGRGRPPSATATTTTISPGRGAPGTVTLMVSI